MWKIPAPHSSITSNRGYNVDKINRFSSQRPGGPWGPSGPMFNMYRELLSRVQRACEADHSPASSSKVKNKKSHISTPTPTPNRFSRHAQRQVYLYPYHEVTTTEHSWYITQHTALHLHRNETTWKTHLLAISFFRENCSKNSPRFLTQLQKPHKVTRRY